MENITDEQKLCKNFEIKDLGKYHHFYVKSDTLLLADVFENFRNMYLKYTNLILQNLFRF